MMNKKIPALAACFLLGLSGCTDIAPKTGPAEAKALETRFLNQYVVPFRNQEVEQWVKVFTEDAVGLHNTRPADVGKAAIAEFGAQVAAFLNIDQFDVKVSQVRFSESGDWAYLWGTYASRFSTKEGQPAPVGGNGKFFTLWGKQPDGEWKIIIDMGNGTKSPATTED